MEDMLLAVQVTDLDWNVVLRMWRRITQTHSLLRLPRARSVKKTALKRMTDFDDVTFQEQFRFTKAEFLVILSNMQDQNGPFKVRSLQGFQIHAHHGQQAIWQAGVERENLERAFPIIRKTLAWHGTPYG